MHEGVSGELQVSDVPRRVFRCVIARIDSQARDGRRARASLARRVAAWMVDMNAKKLCHQRDKADEPELLDAR